MVSVARCTCTGQFCIYLRTTCFSVFQFFKNQTSGTFAHYETIAAGAERT